MHVCAYVCRRTLLRRSEVDVQRHRCTINLQASVRDAHIFTKVCAIFCRGLQHGAWEAAVHEQQAYSMHTDVPDSHLEPLDSTKFHTVNIFLIRRS